ncbi:MAG: efflux RND transporter permease subunit [Candidatus Izemoplasmataceae bacterium]
MKTIISYATNKAITVFMAVTIIVIFGVVSFTRLTTDLFPSMNIPYAVVVTTYPGASPSEVEQRLSRPLEETFATTTNVKDIVSMSQENVSILTLEFNTDTDMDGAMIEMRENLDQVINFLPDEVSRPMIIKINPDMLPIMQFSVSKEGLSKEELTNYVNNNLMSRIERISGVASVSMSGAYESEIQVMLNNERIDQINQSLATMLEMAGIEEGDEGYIQLDRDLIGQILQAQNLAFPVGYVDIENVDYLVRVGDDIGSVEELQELVILHLPMMAMSYTLDDIADIEMVNANENAYAKVNGENAITLTVQKSSNFATTDVTSELLAEIALLEDSDDIDITVLLDQGEYIEMATGSVVDNLLIGGILAVLVLFFFLRSFRATFIVGVAIPISLLFAIILIYLSDITLNIVSLGGLALGIGMLVDNSIVVMENIFRMKQQGLSNKEAAIKGTSQVASAITASTLTTISVFIPIMFIEGFIKEIFMQMALTITFSLVASLLIALTLVPSVASKVLKEDEVSKERKGFMKLKEGYRKVFIGFYRLKFVFLPLILIVFGLSIMLALRNGFEYFPSSDEGQLSITVSNPVENPLSQTEFFAVLDELDDELLMYDDVESVGITLGGGDGVMLGITDENQATVNVILKEDRTNSTIHAEEEFSKMMQESFMMVDYEIQGTQAMTDALTGSGIQVELSGDDLDTLKSEANALALALGDIEGLRDIDAGIGIEADEIKVVVDKETAMQYQITVAQVLGAVSGALQEVSSITSLSISGELYPIYLLDPAIDSEATDMQIEDIENIIVGFNQAAGTPVMVGDVASVSFEKGFASIIRHNGVRTVTVSAAFQEGYNASLVSQDVEALLADYTFDDEVGYTILGENEEIMEAINVLMLAVALGVVLIYMIMASQFQSFRYPFIIMFTIPLAFTGGFLILFFAGLPVSVISLIGLIILTGVVVNNGIVLVDYINQLIDEGYEMYDALIEAGKTRLRPIIMTALTTILALFTMAIGYGQGAEMMQPMAITTIGGLIYGTLLTLFVVPSMYGIMYKFGRLIMQLMFTLILVAAGVILFVLLEQLVFLILGIALGLGMIVYIVLDHKSGVAHD